MDIAQFEGRKRDHLQHALSPENQAAGQSGLDSLRLVHEALPELDLEEVRLETSCIGTRLATPFYVAGMTAGHADAAEINLRIARACARRGWAMGVGSQRRELTDSASLKAMDRWAVLREENPSLVLFANLGLTQCLEVPRAAVEKLVSSLGAQALCIHLNALQESLQPEGTPRFKGGLQKLRELCGEMETPVIVKETGCGMSGRTLARLAETGAAAVDVAGLGGTHWGRVEGARASHDPLRSQAADVFADWGIPTARSVSLAARALPSRTEVWASGGVRTGLDAAKLIALGAHRVGYAKPALEAALAGEEHLDLWMQHQEFQLRIALFCTGSRTPQALRLREEALTS